MDGSTRNESTHLRSKSGQGFADALARLSVVAKENANGGSWNDKDVEEWLNGRASRPSGFDRALKLNSEFKIDKAAFLDGVKVYETAAKLGCDLLMAALGLKVLVRTPNYSDEGHKALIMLAIRQLVEK